LSLRLVLDERSEESVCLAFDKMPTKEKKRKSNRIENPTRGGWNRERG
jgi:hypothetical protein